jgi:outer membrane protein OmpA-like peptidoglycan-associated protein
MNLTATHRHRSIPAVLIALTLAAATLAATAASAASGTPSAPRNVAAKSAAANTPDVTVSWTAPAVAGTSAVSSYNLQSSTSSAFTGATTVALKATSTQATIALPTEGTYYLRMAAVNKAGAGTYSSPIEVIYQVTGTSGGTTTYTCPSGATLNGTNCVATTTTPAISEPTYSCPAGQQLTGADCFIVTQYTATATPVYQEQCPSGWTGDASSECFRFTTVSQTSCTNNGGTWVGGSSNNCEFFTPEVKVQTGTTYSCNGADVLSGTTCTHIVSSPATQGPPYTYGCVAPAVLSGQTCTTTTTTPATKGTSPVITTYGYVEASSSGTTTTTTPGSTTTTTLPGTGLHLTAVVVPFALNSARLSARTDRAIVAIARSVNKLPKGATVVSVTVRGYADPTKSGAFNHALALARARVVSSTFANRLNPNSAYLYKLNVLAGGTKFAASSKEHGTASHRRVTITVDYTS